ncbi:siderophore biosynthesis protein [Streptosporangium sp. 'caverna']|uniref:siderophore biosynthesis protein n=1 Tax=Streptosporangium sp. 'caverna' TaxID=2202249 RepID=UPI0019550FA5|nr:siderophore biosynthesis protein [Streptosporangium sp. 'caverna']
MRLYLTALKPTDSVTDGFLPAAHELGCDVTILTDRPEHHRHAGTEVLGCDVRDARAVIDVIAHHHAPDAIFSNSDHLQAETALAAEYFGLPGKDWRACATTKNKALTRRRLAAAGVEVVRAVRLAAGDPVPRDLPFPAVVKPREGVASEDVVLVRDAGELAAAVRAIRDRRPDEALVVEEYLDGPLHTLETLGDGERTQVLGGFRTRLGPLPYFVEERLDWEPPPGSEHVLRALDALGAGFGACHTEYAMTSAGPRIIEVNYRVIGDHCDFLVADLLGVPLFERILGVHLGAKLSDRGTPGMLAMRPDGPSKPGTEQGEPGMLAMRPDGPSKPGTEQGEPGMKPGGPSKPGAEPGEPGILRAKTGDPGTPAMRPGRPGKLGTEPGGPGAAGGHGTVLSLIADRSGTVVEAPGTIVPAAGDRIRLWHRPLRAVGDRIDQSNTNRDYMGIVRAIGPDRASVDAALTAFTAGNPWVIA